MCIYMNLSFMQIGIKDILCVTYIDMLLGDMAYEYLSNFCFVFGNKIYKIKISKYIYYKRLSKYLYIHYTHVDKSNNSYFP